MALAENNSQYILNLPDSTVVFAKELKTIIRDLATVQGGTGLLANGSVTGATSQVQIFTNGVQTGTITNNNNMQFSVTGAAHSFAFTDDAANAGAGFVTATTGYIQMASSGGDITLSGGNATLTANGGILTLSAPIGNILVTGSITQGSTSFIASGSGGFAVGNTTLTDGTLATIGTLAITASGNKSVTITGGVGGNGGVSLTSTGSGIITAATPNGTITLSPQPGWGIPTGTLYRSALTNASTQAQTNQAVMALITDLYTGAIGLLRS